MSDWIEAATTPEAISASADDTQDIRFIDPGRADRFTRKVIAQIDQCGDATAVRDYLRAESLLIDALHVFDPALSDRISAAASARLSRWETASGGTGQKTQGHTKGKRMAGNPDFHKVVKKNVEFLWPRLDQPYRYNNAEKRTEPCAANVTGAGFSVAFKMSLKDGKDLKEELRAHYEGCRSRNSKLPEFSTVFGSKRLNDEDGNPTDFVQFTAKKRAISNDGKVNKVPEVVGPDHKPLADPAIWTGSVGHIRCLAYPTTDPDGVGGISLMLDAVQVNEAVYGGANLADDFGDPEDPIDAEPAQARATEAARSAPAASSDEF